MRGRHPGAGAHPHRRQLSEFMGEDDSASWNRIGADGKCEINSGKHVFLIRSQEDIASSSRWKVEKGLGRDRGDRLGFVPVNVTPS